MKLGKIKRHPPKCVILPYFSFTTFSCFSIDCYAHMFHVDCLLLELQLMDYKRRFFCILVQKLL